MPRQRPNWANLNLPPAAAAKKAEVFQYVGAEPRLSARVGFGPRFGVKLAVQWAVEFGFPPISCGRKHFKSLKKLAGKG